MGRYNISISKYPGDSILSYTDLCEEVDTILYYFYNDKMMDYYKGLNMYSAMGLKYISEIDKCFHNAYINALNETPTKPEEFDILMTNLSNLIYQDQKENFNDPEKWNEFNYIMAACYLSRATYRNWYEAVSSTKHPWHPFFGPDSKGPIGNFFKKNRSWYCIWLC